MNNYTERFHEIHPLKRPPVYAGNGWFCDEEGVFKLDDNREIGV